MLNTLSCPWAFAHAVSDTSLSPTPSLDYQQIQIQLKKHFLEASRLPLPLSRINALCSLQLSCILLGSLPTLGLYGRFVCLYPPLKLLEGLELGYIHLCVHLYGIKNMLIEWINE